MEGRVEVEFDGKWGTVCDDHFDINAANVVCRQLGFTNGPNYVRKSDYFGQGSGLILLDDVECRGDESSLFLCGHRKIGTHNCNHGQDVGVSCVSNNMMILKKYIIL